eukprot:6133437-Amphidinium_carterae.1
MRILSVSTRRCPPATLIPSIQVVSTCCEVLAGRIDFPRHFDVKAKDLALSDRCAVTAVSAHAV